MTSATMLIVCTLLFLASKSDAANGDAENEVSPCQGNMAGVLLADSSCMTICNGTTPTKNVSAGNGTKCRTSDKNSTAWKMPTNEGAHYGVCQNRSCIPVMRNNNISEPITSKSPNSSIGMHPGPNSTTTSKGKESTVPTKLTTTVLSSAVTSPPTTVVPSTTGAPDANTTTPAANGTTPVANGSSRSRLVSAAGSQVLGVALAICALLLQVP